MLLALIYFLLCVKHKYISCEIFSPITALNVITCDSNSCMVLQCGDGLQFTHWSPAIGIEAVSSFLWTQCFAGFFFTFRTLQQTGNGILGFDQREGDEEEGGVKNDTRCMSFSYWGREPWFCWLMWDGEKMKGFVSCLKTGGAFLVAQKVKNLPAIQETWVWALGWEDPLEKGMATHSSTLAWRIPWTEEPDGLQSMGSQSWTRLNFTASQATGGGWWPSTRIQTWNNCLEWTS